MKRLPFLTPLGSCPACCEPIGLRQRVHATASGDVHAKCLRATVVAFEREMGLEVEAAS